MIKGIRNKIREAVNEAIDLAIRAVEVSHEGMVIHASIGANFQKSTVVVQGAKRPFPINKLDYIIRALRGKWEKKHTTADYTKVESVRHSSPVSVIMRVYTAECLNPQSRDKVEVLKGSRGRVLTPDLCDGAEFSIMRGLGIKESQSEKEVEYV